MADRIQAIRAYTPRIEHKKMAENLVLRELIAGRTSFTEGAVSHMLMELRYVLEFFLKEGQPVRLDGIGIFSTAIKKNGELTVNFRVDGGLKGTLNKPDGGYSGAIINRGMIGKTADQMIERWNREHPDDKINTPKITKPNK